MQEKRRKKFDAPGLDEYPVLDQMSVLSELPPLVVFLSGFFLCCFFACSNDEKDCWRVPQSPKVHAPTYTKKKEKMCKSFMTSPTFASSFKH